MSTLFEVYFKIGFKHILHIDAQDHLLFLLVLCAGFLLKDWKKMLVLVTAFTIGHSITLALAAFKIIKISSALIEFFIPVSILLTGLYYLFRLKSKRDLNISNPRVLYGMALGFGAFHGLGFSNILKASLMPGEENKIVTQLLAFNLGVELAQIIVVLAILLLGFIVVNLLKLKHKFWALGLAIIGIIVSLKWSFEKWPF